MRGIMKIVLGILIGLGFAYAFLFEIDPIVKIVFALFVVFLGMAAVNPPVVFLMLLFIRPLIDPLRVYGFGFFSFLGIFSFINVILIFFVAVKYKQFNFFPRSIKWFYFFALFVLMSLVNEVKVEAALANSLKLMSLLAIFLLSYNLPKSIKDVFRILNVIVFSAIVPIVIGVYQIVTKQGIVQGLDAYRRINSTFALSNPFAFYLGFIILVILLLIYGFPQRRKFVALYSVILTVSFVCLVFTYVRAIWLAVVIALFFTALFERKIRRWVVIGTFFILIVFSGTLFSRFNDIINPPLLRANTLEWRYDMAKQLMMKAVPKYWLIGSGIGTSEEVASKVTSYENLPHNDYLRVLVETGFFGLIFYLMFFFSLLKFFATQIFNKINKENNIIFLGTLIFYLIASLGQNCFIAISASGYMFCLMGVALKLNELKVESAISGVKP